MSQKKTSAPSLLKPPASSLQPRHTSRRRQWQDQAKEFSNRLVRMAKHWKKWARRQGITCFRLYDRDLPEVPLALDWYEGHLHVAEYVRPHDRTDIEHQIWLTRMIEAAAAALEVDPKLVAVKRRGRQRGPAQYERQSEEGRRTIVHEGGHQFEVNLSDYLDTGLFLDHRITRGMVEKEAAGKRFLNLFGYTGAFTVYAAAGGARGNDHRRSFEHLFAMGRAESEAQRFFRLASSNHPIGCHAFPPPHDPRPR